MSIRFPGAIADLLAYAYLTVLRVLGVSGQWSIISDSDNPRRYDFMPSSEGEGPSNVTTLTVMSRDGFSGPAGCQLSPSSHPGRK